MSIKVPATVRRTSRFYVITCIQHEKYFPIVLIFEFSSCNREVAYTSSPRPCPGSGSPSRGCPRFSRTVFRGGGTAPVGVDGPRLSYNFLGRSLREPIDKNSRSILPESFPLFRSICEDDMNTLPNPSSDSSGLPISLI
jgi:hypothetical protein